MLRTVRLRQLWADTNVDPGAYIHVIGDFDRRGECIINDEYGMIILHPDFLISSTVIADSYSCMRRAVLQDRVKATNDSSPALIYGTILHEVFQEAMKANCWDDEYLNILIEDTAVRHMEDLYITKLEVHQAVDYLKSKMNEVQAWAAVFVASNPKVILIL
jgi:DNA replication ATP-dependent helicase Dna2